MSRRAPAGSPAAWLARLRRLVVVLALATLALLAPRSAAASQSVMSAAPSTMSEAPSRSAAPRRQGPPPGPTQLRRTPVRPVRQIATPAPSFLDSTAEAGRVTVRSPAALHREAKRLAAAAAGALARIATDLPDLPTPGPIEVRLVEDASQLASVAPSGRGAPAYAIGLAYPDLGVVSIALRRGAQVEDAEATLRHELAHIALGAAIGDAATRWLHEGFAYQHSAEWSWERTETLAGMVWFHSIIPLAQLDRSFPDQELATHRAYAESYDFVGFLSRRGRWEDHSDDGDRYPFRRFLAALAGGASMDAAAVEAFGRPIDALFQEWQDELGDRLMFAPVGLFALSLWLLAAFLLVLGALRRRRQARVTLARWDREEATRPRYDDAHAEGPDGASFDDHDAPAPAPAPGPGPGPSMVYQDTTAPVAPGLTSGRINGAEPHDDEDRDDAERDPDRPPRLWN